MINEDYITEDYVSYEVAKLLKDKGFNIECNTAYYNGRLIDYTMYGFCGVLDFIFAPTLQMAMKWLREVYKLHIDIDPSEGDWNPTVITLKDWSCAIKYGDNIPIQDTYEEAVEAALKYCLKKLI